MSMSYGRRVPVRALPEATSLSGVLARGERVLVPLAIVALFAFPNPLVPVALAVLAVSAAVRLARGRLSLTTPVDAWMLLFGVGTCIGLAVAHHQGAAWLRFTGIVGAVATLYAIRAWTHTERDLRIVSIAVIGSVGVGILVVLALLRGILPESAVARALSPLTAPFAMFPGVSGDTLEVNARFAVHQYGLAHLLLVGALFAVAAIALSGSRRRIVIGGLALVLLVPFLLATQARGAFLAFALAATVVTAYRTRLAWAIPPLAGLALYVLLVRGTISRGVEADWLNERLSYWTGTLSLLGDVPFTGSGLGMRTFAEVFAWYHALPDPYQVSHSHNVVVQAYAEQGLLGAVGLAGLLVVGSLTALRATRQAQGPTRWLVAGAAGGFVGSALYGLTDQVPTNTFSLALMLALLGSVVVADRLWSAEPSPAAHSHDTPSPPGLLSLWARAVGIKGSHGRVDGVREAPGVRIRGLLAAVAAVVVLGGIALAPRWISGAYLNVGSATMLDAVLDRSLDADTRAARLASAEAALSDSVYWNPANVPALRNLGRVRLLRHDLPGASEAIQAAYRPDATAFERTQLARLSYDAGLVGLTIQLYKEGGDEAKLAALAERLWGSRRWHEAALAYVALTEMNPDEAEYISNFAKVVLDGGGDDRDALTALLAAVRRKPESARSLARQLVLTGEPFRSDEKRGGGNFTAARFWFGLASQVDPNYDRPEVELGSIHFYRGLFPEAAAHFQEASRRDPRNPSTYSQLGDTYIKLGRLPEAVAFFEMGVRLRPDRPELHANLARAYLLVGRREDALREFRMAVDRAPEGTPLKPALLDELRRAEAGG
jgi:tetratricopeptide (TPR) repeat protein